MKESFVNVFKVLLVMYRFSSAFLWYSAFCNICNVKWFWYHFCRYVSIFQSLLFDFMLFKPLILLSQLYTLVNFFSHESGLTKILKYEAISSTLSGEYLNVPSGEDMVTNWNSKKMFLSVPLERILSYKQFILIFANFRRSLQFYTSI